MEACEAVRSYARPGEGTTQEQRVARKSQTEQGTGVVSELPLFVSEVQAAKLLGVSRTTFRRWVAAGHLHPVFMPGGERRKLYHRDDIAAFARWLADEGVCRADLVTGRSQ
jgi:excisionase family DNA binding protein